MQVTKTVYARTRAAWRAWLSKHHAGKSEIWLVYYKKGSGKASVSYAEAVEEALCFGWIDSTVKTLDSTRYAQRFTPRKRGSNWSRPNLERVARLIANRQMTPAGAAHIPNKREAAAFLVKHELRLSGPTVAPRDLSAALRANREAAASWNTLTPGYRRTYVRWITDVKQPAARARRIVRAVESLALGIKKILL